MRSCAILPGSCGIPDTTHHSSWLTVLLFILIGSIPSSILFAGSAQPGDLVTYYVSSNGNDQWSGSKSEPNAVRTDGPFASLQRARDAVRKALASGLHPSVQIRGGTYRITTTLLLGPEDSGTNEQPVVWSAYPGETVRFIGGTTLQGFQRVHDPAVITRLVSGARDSVFVTDLRKQGITDFGTPPARMNLFFRGTRMAVARFPDHGWLKIAGVPLMEGQILNPGDKKVIMKDLPAGRHSGMFQYDGNRPSRWTDQRDIWMHGYWVWDWRDDYQKVERIDTASRTVFPQPPHHHYGYQKGQRYYFLNVLEELDTPGEWYLDAERGLLYFWPPSAIGPDDVTVSLLKEPMVAAQRRRPCAISGSDTSRAPASVRSRSAGAMTTWSRPARSATSTTTPAWSSTAGGRTA